MSPREKRAYPSSMRLPTCTPTRIVASAAKCRCRSSIHAGFGNFPSSRVVSESPQITDRVSTAHATMPVAREIHQYVRGSSMVRRPWSW